MNAAVIRSTRRAYLSKIRLKKTLWLILFFVVILFPVVVILVTNLQNNTWREWQRDLAS